jgi:hypothetical protein
LCPDFAREYCVPANPTGSWVGADFSNKFLQLCDRIKKFSGTEHWLQGTCFDKDDVGLDGEITGFRRLRKTRVVLTFFTPIFGDLADKG